MAKYRLRWLRLINIVVSFVLLSQFAIFSVRAQSDPNLKEQKVTLFADLTNVDLFSWDSWPIPTYSGAIEAWSNIALDKNNNPHIAYSSNYDNPDYSELVHVAWNGSEWVNTQVDNHDYYGFEGISIAIDSNSNPHISYVAYESELRHAYWNGSSWNTETVSNPYEAYRTVIIIDNQDRPHIAYYSNWGGYEVASWTGSHWTFRELEADNCYEVDWLQFDMDLDDNDNPHFLYTATNPCFQTTETWMKYASWNGSDWDIEFVREDSEASGLEVVDGYPYIAFHDNGVNVGMKMGGLWGIRNVDVDGNGRYASLAVPTFDEVYVSYGSNDNLMIAYGQGLPDQTQVIPTNPGDGIYAPNLAIDGEGNAHVQYSSDPMMFAYGISNSTGGVDLRQDGAIQVSENPIEGGKVFLTIPVKNYGTQSTPPMHVYSEGNNSKGNLWRADDAQPTAIVLGPGESTNFTISSPLWCDHDGWWDTSIGLFIWNDSTNTYYGPLDSNGYEQNISFYVENLDLRQDGPIIISGTLTEGERVFLEVPVRNYGSIASPRIHPYSEGYTSLGNLWRADGANPTAVVLQPGESQNFILQHDLWYGHTGQWNTYGAYVWNDDHETYSCPLIANGYNQQLTFNVKSAQGLPTIDLSISSVEPVQVIEGQDLVRDKATAVKVEVTKIGADPVINVQVTLSIGSSKHNTFFVADPENMKEDNHFVLEKDQIGFPLDFSSGDDTKTIYFIDPELKASGSSFIASVQVHTPNDIIDSDENNNILSSESFQVHDTYWGTHFPGLDVKYFRIDWGNRDLEYFTLFTQLQNDFIQGVFPIAEKRFNPENLLEFVGDSSPYQTIGFDNKLNLLSMPIFVTTEFAQLFLADPLIDRYIGLVPPFWFENETTFTNSHGIFYPLAPRLVIGETLFNQNNPHQPNGISPVAHELGHSYGLWTGTWPDNCEEYQDNLLCPNPSMADGIGNYSAPGIWVQKRIPMHASASRKIYCFMGGTGGIEYWVDQDDYNTLLTDHIANETLLTNKSNVQSGTLLAIGTIESSGTVSLDDWYILPQTDTDPLPPGPYSFVYLNDLGEAINELPFDVAFEIDNGNENIPVDSVPFVLRIPNFTGTASIEVRENGTKLAEKVVTENNPEVLILSPNGGEVHDKTVTITWDGSDTDGDELSYTVLLSDDNGISWTPLAGNLTSTNLEWEIEHFGAGSKYKIKVIATDGFNTGEDLSDHTFSILGRIFLPLSTR